MAYNRAPEKDNAPEMIERVVYLNRVSKTVKGGRADKGGEKRDFLSAIRSCFFPRG